MPVAVCRRADREVCAMSSSSESTILGGTAAECVRHSRTLAVGLDELRDERWGGRRPTPDVRLSVAARWISLSRVRARLEVPSPRRSLPLGAIFVLEAVVVPPLLLFTSPWLAPLIGSPRRERCRGGRLSSSSSMERPFLLTSRPWSEEAATCRLRGLLLYRGRPMSMSS